MRHTTALALLALSFGLQVPAEAQGQAFGWARIAAARTPITFDVDDPVATWSPFPTTMPQAIYGLDFDAEAVELRGVTLSIGYYGVIDQTTGDFTITGTSNLPPGQTYGLTAHPDGVTWYALVSDFAGATTQIWRTTGTFEEFAPLGPPNVGLRLWTLACRADGALFGYEVGADGFYSIDPSTGAATLIGTLGFDANYVQDMDFDWSTGKLIATLSGPSGVFLSEINTATGAAILGEELTSLTSQATIAIKSPRPAVIERTCHPANDNITGQPTKLRGQMDAPVGSGLHLEAKDGPPGAFGLFVVSSGLLDPGVPLSNGNLCVSFAPGESSGRYMGPGELNSIGSFDASGIFVNLSGTSTVGTGFDVPSTLPVPGAPTITMGQTWHFQLWHRDGPTASNLSNAVSVTF